MSTRIDYVYTADFKADFKKLLKKFRTLKDDLETAKINAIEIFHIRKIDNGAVKQISGFSHPEVKVYKLRKFACKALKGRGARSGIRMIYAYHPMLNKVTFIEIYFKSQQENANLERIKAWLLENA